MLRMQRRSHTYQEDYEAIKRTIMPKTETTDENQATDKERYLGHQKPPFI